MSVRAKFTVQRHEQSLGGPRRDPATGQIVNPVYHTVVLNAVYAGGSDENDRFFAATPNGEIKIAMVSAETAALFELGAAYYVDFTRAE